MSTHSNSTVDPGSIATANENPVLRIGSKLLTHALLIVLSATMLLPFLWMVLTAFKSQPQTFSIPPTLLPDPWIFTNFADSLSAMPFGRAYWNSFYVAVLTVILQLATCSMAAYAFARIEFPFKELIFGLFLATMMIPGHVTIIPLYLIMRDLGWLDTHLSLIIPSGLFSAFGVFLLRQFMKTMPIELEEAAFLEGADRGRIFLQITLPLLKAPLAALAVFTFLGSWNSLFTPNIFLSSEKMFTVPLMLNFFKGMYVTDWTLLMAGATIAVIPVLIVFLIGQKYIIEGIALTGIKA